MTDRCSVNSNFRKNQWIVNGKVIYYLDFLFFLMIKMNGFTFDEFMIMNENKTWKSVSVRDIECNATMTVTFIEESDRQQIKYFKLVILCLFYWLIIFHSMKVTAEVLTVSIQLNSEWQNALSTSMGPRETLRIMTCCASCL